MRLTKFQEKVREDRIIRTIMNSGLYDPVTEEYMITISDIANETGYTRETVANVYEKLIEKGKIEKTERSANFYFGTKIK